MCALQWTHSDLYRDQPACDAGVLLLDDEPDTGWKARLLRSILKARPQGLEPETNWVGTSHAANYTRDAYF